MQQKNWTFRTIHGQNTWFRWYYNTEEQPSKPIYDDVLEFIKADYQVSIDGIKTITDLMESDIFDITTYDLMKEYLKDEEEDMYWSEGQIELVEKIGKEYFIFKFL